MIDLEKAAAAVSAGDPSAFPDIVLATQERLVRLSAQQVVIVLKSVEQLSSAEIAEILGCSEGAVEQRLVRARSALRKMGADP